MFKRWIKRIKMRRAARREEKIRELGYVPASELDAEHAKCKKYEVDVAFWKSVARCMNTKIAKFQASTICIDVPVRSIDKYCTWDDIVERSKQLAIRQIGTAIYDAARHTVNNRGEYIATVCVMDLNKYQSPCNVMPHVCSIVESDASK